MHFRCATLSSPHPYRTNLVLLAAFWHHSSAAWLQVLKHSSISSRSQPMRPSPWSGRFQKAWLSVAPGSSAVGRFVQMRMGKWTGTRVGPATCKSGQDEYERSIPIPIIGARCRAGNLEAARRGCGFRSTIPVLAPLSGDHTFRGFRLAHLARRRMRISDGCHPRCSSRR